MPSPSPLLPKLDKVSKTEIILQQNYLKESCFTLKALERFKKFNQGTSAELFMVLGCHLDTDLQVLSDVVCEHGTKTLQ